MSTRYFDLDRFKAGFPAWTRDGRHAMCNLTDHDRFVRVRIAGGLTSDCGKYNWPEWDFTYTEDGTFSDISGFPIDKLDLFMKPFDPATASREECILELMVNDWKMIRMEEALTVARDTFKRYQTLHMKKVDWTTYVDKGERDGEGNHFSDPVCAEASRKANENLMSSRACEDAIPQTEFKERTTP